MITLLKHCVLLRYKKMSNVFSDVSILLYVHFHFNCSIISISIVSFSLLPTGPSGSTRCPDVCETVHLLLLLLLLLLNFCVP